MRTKSHYDLTFAREEVLRRSWKSLCLRDYLEIDISIHLPSFICSTIPHYVYGGRVRGEGVKKDVSNGGRGGIAKRGDIIKCVGIHRRLSKSMKPYRALF